VAKKKQTLNVGVVGLGIGRWHASQYDEYGRCNLVAACDQNAHLRSITAEKHNLPADQCYDDYRKMFADAKRIGLDAISIALPNKLHAPVAIAALKAGLHVLCEKPMATSTAEARRMLAAAKAARKTLMINFSSRFEWESMAIKRAVEAGELGDIYFARSIWHRRRGIPIWSEWFYTRELSGGGPIIDLGVHRLDLAMWLMGNPKPVTVSGSTFAVFGPEIARKQGKKYDVEDLGCAMIRFDNGAALILEASWAANIELDDEIATQLYGSKAGVIYRKLPDPAETEVVVFGEANGSMRNSRLAKPIGATPSSFQEFVDACLDGREPIATAEHGLNVQLILDATYKSAATGREVRIK
jgi:predicted dehydrogenase